MKIKKMILPVLAVLGVISAIRTVVSGIRNPPVAAPVVEPAKPPFDSYVAGSGIIEASSENIAIATPISGVVAEVFVAVGAKVRTGDPLFRLDSRDLTAALERAKAAVLVAKAQLDDANVQFQRLQNIKDKSVVSVEEFSKRNAAAQIAIARLREAEAAVRTVETELERIIVRAPLDATVLQVRVRIGEFAMAQVMAVPLMILGNLERLHVRVDVDENDAWRLKAGAEGQAFLRGNAQITFPLEFVRFEPYVIPKRSLTGESSERVDTRVLQILFGFNPGDLPVFVGQLVDVYIEASEK